MDYCRRKMGPQMRQETMTMQNSEDGFPVCVDALGKLDRLFTLLKAEREIQIDDTHSSQV